MLGGTTPRVAEHWQKQKEAERRSYAERSGTEEKQKKEGNGGTMPSVAERRRNRGAETMNGGDLWHSAK